MRLVELAVASLSHSVVPLGVLERHRLDASGEGGQRQQGDRQRRALIHVDVDRGKKSRATAAARLDRPSFEPQR